MWHTLVLKCDQPRRKGVEKEFIHTTDDSKLHQEVLKRASKDYLHVTEWALQEGQTVEHALKGIRWQDFPMHGPIPNPKRKEDKA